MGLDFICMQTEITKTGSENKSVIFGRNYKIETKNGIQLIRHL